MPGSVKTKSTGFKEPTVKYSNTENNNDDGNPHPSTDGVPSESEGKDDGKEYHEVASAGIESHGVGNLSCNDAACERVSKHPSADDLKDGGSMGTRKAME
jgi:hypothetical protein